MQGPFFIVGCGRSGTTLLRSMLNSHPELSIPTESLFIIDYLRSKRIQKTGNVQVAGMLAREYEVKEWGLDIDPSDLASCKSVPEIISKLHESYANKYNKKFWGQKTPRFVRHASLLKNAFPGCSFIHVIRDPRAVASSMILSNVHRSNSYFACKRWTKDVTAGLQIEQDYPACSIRITYEELIVNPQKTLSSICSFLGVEFHNTLLHFQESLHRDYGQFYKQVHNKLSKPVDRSSIDAWRDKLSLKDIMIVESLCGAYMKRLGYKQLYPDERFELGSKYKAYLSKAPRFAKMLKHYIANRPGYLKCVLLRKTTLGTLPTLLDDIL